MKKKKKSDWRKGRHSFGYIVLKGYLTDLINLCVFFFFLMACSQFGLTFFSKICIYPSDNGKIQSMPYLINSEITFLRMKQEKKIKFCNSSSF